MDEAVMSMETAEKKYCNLPLIFAEMFKDEINAIDEKRLYNGVKRIIKKYSPDKNAVSVIDEFTRVISGGASLMEIINISIDEARNPSLALDITIDSSCRSGKNDD